MRRMRLSLKSLNVCYLTGLFGAGVEKYILSTEFRSPDLSYRLSILANLAVQTA